MGLSSCSYVCTHVWSTLKLFVALPPPVGDHARLLGSSPPRAARAPACPASRGRHRLGAPCYCGGCRTCDTPPPPPLLDGNARALLPCPAAALPCCARSRSRHITDQPTEQPQHSRREGTCVRGAWRLPRAGVLVRSCDQ